MDRITLALFATISSLVLLLSQAEVSVAQSGDGTVAVGFSVREPVAEEVTIDLLTIDQFTKTGVSQTPVSGAKVKVFDRDVLNGLEVTLLDGITKVSLTKNPDGSLYPDIFESLEAKAAQVSSCTTDIDGHAICVEATPGNYLVLVEFVDIDGRKVISGKPKSLEDLVDVDADGNIDLINHTGICFDTSQNPLLDTNGDWTDNNCDGVLDTGVTKEFQIIKVIRKKTDEFGQPIVELGRGSKRVVVGSYLEIIYPEFTIWEEGVTSYLYPFILTSDSEWTADICAEVPVGYDIVGVYDAFGNLFATTKCVHTVVANTKLVVAFEVVDLASPPPQVTATFTVRDQRGNVHNFGLHTGGHRKGKDASMSLSEPKAKFLLLADSVGGRMEDLANDIAFRINVDQKGIVSGGTGDNEVALEVNKVWFNTKIEEGKRILIAEFSDAGDPVLPPQDVTNSCTTTTDQIVCAALLTGPQGSLAVFALAAITVPNTPPVATAAFVPIDVGEIEGTFSIVATGTDPDADPTTVLAVITTPSTVGLELHLIESVDLKISFDLEGGKLTILGPDPRAILEVLRQSNGFPVQDGETIKVRIEDNQMVKIDRPKNGALKIIAPLVYLEVTVTDAFGASSTATASLIFAPEVTATVGLDTPIFATANAVIGQGDEKRVNENEKVVVEPVVHLQAPKASPLVFSQTIARINVDKETQLETPDGQVGLIVPADFLGPEAALRTIELELKNLDPATFKVPEEGQFIRVIEVNSLVDGRDGLVNSATPVMLVIPLNFQDIARSGGDPSTLMVLRLDPVTDIWEPLPTNFNDSSGPPRLLAYLHDLNHSTIGVFHPNAKQQQTELPPAVGVAGGAPAKPISELTKGSGWPRTWVAGFTAGVIGVLLIVFAGSALLRRRPQRPVETPV